jgi:3-phenylpropionate/trans-cinnamate dioxygenase ferredoxin subunit/anthranilate 1,2-dioxygenase ferredoxin subunit
VNAVATLDQLAPGGMISVKFNGEDVALCRVNGTVYALSRKCGHKGAALDRGSLAGYIITCPLHYAQFDVRTGAVLSPATPQDHTANKEAIIPQEDREFPSLRTYKVEVRGRDIFLQA